MLDSASAFPYPPPLIATGPGLARPDLLDFGAIP